MGRPVVRLCAIHVQQISQAAERTDAKRARSLFLSYGCLTPLFAFLFRPKSFHVLIFDSLLRDRTRNSSLAGISPAARAQCDVQASKQFCQVGPIFFLEESLFSDSSEQIHLTQKALFETWHACDVLARVRACAHKKRPHQQINNFVLPLRLQISLSGLPYTTSTECWDFFEPLPPL